MMKKTLFGIAFLCSSTVMADNTVLEENLASEGQSLSKVTLSSCVVEIDNAQNDSLRQKADNNRLLHIKVADKDYYAASIALFERDEGQCDLILKGLVNKG